MSVYVASVAGLAVAFEAQTLVRTIALVLNAIIVVFFVGFLIYTIFAQRHLEGLAGEFVTEKTIEYSDTIVDLTERSLNLALVQKLFANEEIKAARREVAEYHKDPAAYVTDLTRQRAKDPKLARPNPLQAKVETFKEKIRNFYDNTLAALVLDLRIFAGSNLVAGIIGFALAYRSAIPIRPSIVVFAFLTFVGVLYCSYMYVDDLTFFRILFRTHLGWTYPVFLSVTIVALYVEHGHSLRRSVET